MKKLIVFLLSSLLCVGAIAQTTVVTNVVYVQAPPQVVTNVVYVQSPPQTVVVQQPQVVYQPAPVVYTYPYYPYYYSRPVIGIGIGFRFGEIGRAHV